MLFNNAPIIRLSLIQNQHVPPWRCLLCMLTVWNCIARLVCVLTWAASAKVCESPTSFVR